MIYAMICFAVCTWVAVFILEYRKARKKIAEQKAAEAAKATEETPTDTTPEN